MTQSITPQWEREFDKKFPGWNGVQAKETKKRIKSFISNLLSTHNQQVIGAINKLPSYNLDYVFHSMEKDVDNAGDYLLTEDVLKALKAQKLVEGKV